jgi:hypothetical protein
MRTAAPVTMSLGLQMDNRYRGGTQASRSRYQQTPEIR